MAGAHRIDDARSCGATTVASGNTTVYVNGKLRAVEGDPNTHGNGKLIATVGHTVFVQGKKVIVEGDNASPDGLCPRPGGEHCNPKAVGKSGDVSSY